ncbi:MAG TPA: UDP-N-acetylmuramoyl-L-alanine--D-glutamate ligase [Steroidobacteraceae bacterium]|jgi:UDP-N-acetylmuramoylalanine--D-glutamate ligase|nr:UDP-N-acetylmuramoyl-L-alanine--D-glutamate ligase [Steroidobacteraceae bacterium]
MSPRSASPADASAAVVVGLGRTGASAARYLLARGLRVAVTDSREDPPGRALLADSAAQLTLRTGGFDAALLEGAGMVVLSPGVAPVGGFFDEARARGIPLLGDIELFARAVRAPVAAITGTNGKSTVTTLLAQMAQRAGLQVRAGGNLGVPALDLLAPAVQLYVLELSSFQLETTQSLLLAAAAVLNVSADHLDRYPDIRAYAAAKARIFAHCDVAVVNHDDALVAAMPRSGQARLSFSVGAAAGGAAATGLTAPPADYYLDERAGERWLMRRGEPLLPLSELKLGGLHNAANALAALALAEALALPRAACLAALREFAGLAHRMQRVAEVRGVRYVDDSKGTNVGATLAAVCGLTAALIVIAGGEGKGQDFSPLRAAFAGKVRHALLIGRDAHLVGAALAGACECVYCATLEEAVARAAALGRPGDVVLLSPACASLDMFRDYAHRGEVFAEAVRRLAA